ncbi:hypothetical protein GQV58_001402 [Salmonella enterica]|nr:hypothetical protein [Salmonella enterica subsp. enterica serovar Muenchen]
MINKVKAKSNDHIEEWGEVTNKIQSFYHWVGKNYFTNHIDIYRIVMGKAGLRFWRFWFLSFIPWERKTVTPASIWQHTALERIYDSPETVRK